MAATEDELKAAWEKVKDSKDYISHALIAGEPDSALTWALRMRKELTYFISLLDDE